jgi:hypothetical protein
MRQHLERPVSALLVAFILAAFSSGCGALRTRFPVPPELTEHAEVPGYVHIRFWGDAASAEFEDNVIEALDREHAALGLPPDVRELPGTAALVISGGGDDGAFAAGILNGWTRRGDRPTFRVVTGVSTGALVAPFAFLGADYDDELAAAYTTIAPKDVFRIRNLLTILRSDSAADTEPLRELTKKWFTEEMLDRIAVEHAKGRRLLVATTNLDAQRPVIWDVGRIASSGRPDRVELFRDVLLGSAAIPGAFSPVYIRVRADGRDYDEMHVDGGTTMQLFLFPADIAPSTIRARAGYTRGRSTVYVIRNGRLWPETQPIQPRVAAIAGRAISTLIKSQGYGNLEILYQACVSQGDEFRLLSIPDFVPYTAKTTFDQQYMRKLYDVGFMMGAAPDAWQNAPPRVEAPGERLRRVVRSSTQPTPGTQPTTRPDE